MANRAESSEDLNNCGNSETEDKDDDAAEPIFPPEVVIEILCWLPVRSLAKLQLVCKEWRGFIRGRYLMEKNVDRRPVILPLYNVMSLNDPAKRNHEEERFALLDCCDGLLLVKISPTMKLAIWNPATRGILHLPAGNRDAFGVTLNYVQSSGNYLVVSMYKDNLGVERCEVITPGQSESWRPLAFPDVEEADGLLNNNYVEVVSTGEAVHTVVILRVGHTLVRKVVSLDLETECFTVTCIAEMEFQDLTTLWPVNWNGKLALTKLVGYNLHVTELEDYKKQRWCQKDKVIPLSFLREEYQEFTPLVPSFAKNGVIWFTIDDFKIISYPIETDRLLPLHSSKSSAPLAGKPYPYKPTLVGLQGMQQDPEFGKRLSLKLANT